jgi:multisubunit Na+/H+ antiporter MnhG subunit
LGVLLTFGFSWVSAKLVIVVIFQWLTAPVSGHLIARMMYYNEEDDVAHHAQITFPREEEGKN